MTYRGPSPILVGMVGLDSPCRVTICQHDQSVRVSLSDEQGAIISYKERRLPSADSDLRSECDGHDLWLTVKALAQDCLNDRERHPISGVSLVTEPGSAVIWRKESGHPTTPVLLPGDFRASTRREHFRDRGWTQPMLTRTGRRLTEDSFGFKLDWLLEENPNQRPEAAAGALCAGEIDSFLLWKLTGSTTHSTSSAHAASSLLYNIEGEVWDREILEVFTIPGNCLPSIASSHHAFGQTRFGGLLPAPVPVDFVTTTEHIAAAQWHAENPDGLLITPDIDLVGPARKTRGTSQPGGFETFHYRISDGASVFYTVSRASPWVPLTRMLSEKAISPEIAPAADIPDSSLLRDENFPGRERLQAFTGTSKAAMAAALSSVVESVIDTAKAWPESPLEAITISSRMLGERQLARVREETKIAVTLQPPKTLEASIVATIRADGELDRNEESDS